MPEALSGPVGSILSYVRAAVTPLEKLVASGQVVPKFGSKAHDVLSSVVGAVGSGVPGIERVVDGMLETLFVQQLVLVRRQLVAKFEKAKVPMEAVSQADGQFVSQAEELVMPGSDWSFQQERYALRSELEGSYRRDRAVAQDQAQSSQTQQLTMEIISKLQSQMEALQARIQQLRSGSPWFVSTSYRIPKTPLQLIGRYQQGRASVEFNLNPDRDPANSEAGFVEGVGPANLGVSLNVGI